MKNWQFWILIAAVLSLPLVEKAAEEFAPSPIALPAVVQNTVHVDTDSLAAVLTGQWQQEQDFWKVVAACLCESVDNPYKEYLERYKGGQ